MSSGIRNPAAVHADATCEAVASVTANIPIGNGPERSQAANDVVNAALSQPHSVGSKISARRPCSASAFAKASRRGSLQAGRPASHT